MQVWTAAATAAITLALIGTVGALTWHGDITGEASVAFFGVLAGAGTVGGAQHVGARQGAKAALAKNEGDI